MIVVPWKGTGSRSAKEGKARFRCGAVHMVAFSWQAQGCVLVACVL